MLRDRVSYGVSSRVCIIHKILFTAFGFVIELELGGAITFFEVEED